MRALTAPTVSSLRRPLRLEWTVDPITSRLTCRWVVDEPQPAVVQPAARAA
jgi:hypothetical protein